MNIPWKAIAGLVLFFSLIAVDGQTTTGGSTTARTTHQAAPKRPSIQSQIEELRQDMDAQRAQIDSLKQQLSERDTQLLQQVQQAAVAAQAAAQQAQEAAQTQQAALVASNQTVTGLQGAVADLRTSNQTAVATFNAEQVKIHQQIEHPDMLHYKGITLSPNGSFVEAATINRTSATASDIATPFNSIPYSGADAAHMSEFYGTARQSRLALDAEGRVQNGIIRGYWEMDWLGVGVTSNNNESNSYVMRQRLLFAQAVLDNGWTFTGGQQWSLATETRVGVDNRTEALPLTIDPNYTVGLVWERQWGLRVSKKIGDRFWLGTSLENPQLLAPSCAHAGGTAACPVNFVAGAAGTGGGLYNNGGQPGASSSAPLATYSYNLAPDVIAKLAVQPNWGHFEVFGVARFFRDRVYPNATPAGTGSAAGAYNDTTIGGGIGGGGRFYLAQKRFEIGLHGLWGDGVGRYGASTLPDTTLRPTGQLALLHGFSTLGELVVHPTKRFDLYFDYGMEFAGRRYFANNGGLMGYGIPNAVNTGCSAEPLPGTGPTAGYAPSNPADCAGITKDTQEPTFGYWYNIYAGEHGRLRQGFQYSYVVRNAWSGIGGSPMATNNVIETSLRYFVP